MEEFLTYRIEIENKWNYNCPEDGWLSEGYGYTLNEAFQESYAEGWKRGHIDGFEPMKIYVTELHTLNHNGQLYDSRVKCPTYVLSYNDMLKLLEDNDLYIKAIIKRRNILRDEELKVAIEETEKMKLEEERRKYEELRKKFEPGLSTE